MKRTLLLIARVAVAGSLLYWLFRSAGGLGPVWDVMRHARVEWLVAGFAGTLVVQGMIAHRLQRIAAVQGGMLRTREVLAINLTTLFYGLFLPGGGATAVAIRFWRLTRRDRRYASTMVAIVCDRMFATLTLCLAGLAFWWLDGGESRVGLIVLLAGTAVSAAAMLPIFTPAPARWVGAVASRVPVAKRVWPRVDEALAMCRALPVRARVELGIFSIAAHGLGALVYLLLARSLAVTTPLAALGWMRSVSGLVTLTPISISGLGLREAVLVTLLVQRSIPHALALAYSLLVFGVTVLAVGLSGGVIEAAQWLAPRPETDTTSRA